MFQVKQSWGCCSRPGRHLSLLAWCKHRGDNRGQRHGVHRASMRAKLWGSPHLTHSPLGWSPTPSNTHGPSSEARLVQAMGQRPTGATLVPGWWEQRGWAGPHPQGGSTGAPTQVGMAQRGISQHCRQLLHTETPCALWFWKVTFLTPKESRVSVLKTRTKKIHCLVLPARAAGAAPPAAESGQAAPDAKPAGFSGLAEIF